MKKCLLCGKENYCLVCNECINTKVEYEEDIPMLVKEQTGIDLCPNCIFKMMDPIYYDANGDPICRECLNEFMHGFWDEYEDDSLDNYLIENSFQKFLNTTPSYDCPKCRNITYTDADQWSCYNCNYSPFEEDPEKEMECERTFWNYPITNLQKRNIKIDKTGIYFAILNGEDELVDYCKLHKWNKEAGN